MSISLSTLQQELFEVVDQVISTGRAVEINRNGHIVKIILEDKKSKLESLKKHDCIIGDPDDLVNVSTSEWGECKNL